MPTSSLKSFGFDQIEMWKCPHCSHPFYWRIQVEQVKNSFFFFFKRKGRRALNADSINEIKARRTGDDKQFNTFYKTNSKPKFFTADVQCNGTVVKLPETERAILFLNLNSRSMVANSSFVRFQPCCTLPTLNGTNVRNFQF